MEDKPLTESINKQYSKYGSLRTKENESGVKLYNSEESWPKFLTRIDSSIKDAKARVKKSIDNSTISEDYESSLDQQPNDNLLDAIPMVKFERTTTTSNISSSSMVSSQAAGSPSAKTAPPDGLVTQTRTVTSPTDNELPKPSSSS